MKIELAADAPWYELLVELLTRGTEATEANPTVIGFGYTRRVGKDYAAQVVADYYGSWPGITVVRYAFAKEVKQGLTDVLWALGLNAFTEDPREKELIRPLLVAHGELGRAVQPDHWIKLVELDLRREARRILGRGMKPLFLITDVRYRNEAEWVKAMGGKLLEIHGDAEPNETERKHAAQCQELSDAVVFNGKDEGFQSRVLEAVEAWV